LGECQSFRIGDVNVRSGWVDGRGLVAGGRAEA